VSLPSPHLTSAEDFEVFLKERGVDPSSMTMTEAGTFCPPGTSPSVEQLLEDLPTLVGEGNEYQVFAPLGAGGMGEVLMAKQRSLGRHVAIKRAQVSDALGRTVLTEARVAGSLEHPNIVPIYGLARAEDGAPVIVMKKIEGRPWSRLLHKRAELKQDKDEHVAHLIKVCDAIAFAHARGVLHCDLKPDNIMIGDFGQAYVLDWGIAAALPGKGPADIRQADAEMTVAGTAAYLPPEVARMEGQLTVASDIYLLGGLLCVLLTGKAPHAGGSATDALLAAARGDLPSFPEGAPEDLVDLCCRALASDPRQRPASVRAFQEELEAHLKHAAARRLLRFARGKLADLKALCAAEEEDAHQIRRVFLETSFAFAAAVREWPESVVPEAGRVSALVVMIKHELSKGRAESAAMLIGELDDVPAELAQELHELRSRRERQAAQVEVLQHKVAEGDARYGTRLRGTMVLVLSALWVGSQIILRNLPSVGAPPLSDMHAGLIGQVLQLTVAGGFIFRFRRTLLSHQGSRVTIFQIVSTLLLAFLAWVCGWMMDLSMPVVIAFTHLIMGMGAMAVAVRIHEFWPGASVIALAAVPIALLPEHAYLINAATLLLAFGVYVVMSPRIEARSFTRDGITATPHEGD
jgi:hypothetical protein